MASKFKHINMVEEHKLEVFVDGLNDMLGATSPIPFGTMDDKVLTLLPTNASQPPRMVACDHACWQVESVMRQARSLAFMG